jgi:hypothetical protein
MIIDTIKADILSATKSRNTTASEILEVVLGECQSKDNFTDDFVIRYCRKLVEANTETMKFGDYAKLSRQNELLRSYLPKEVSEDELVVYAKQISEDIKSAKSDGQAVGALVKHVKALGLTANGDLAKKVIAILRSNS